ncbi:hypothetical protein [Snodgrassella sp. ESL0253]|uniref:hypothetical protein n=1 Tax=Snodgrassella sp. ESL0253 TaxID=2705031 RepID=UPI001582BE52|nr:hypothetical protein [Snodgrassella sp. ESL0253]NUE65643.1 hypothetical protein [Snodgrassella sp. ESL0253]
MPILNSSYQLGGQVLVVAMAELFADKFRSIGGEGVSGRLQVGLAAEDAGDGTGDGVQGTALAAADTP